jgi:hypothetical protein
VDRNSQHLGQISDRHESLADIERHDHLRSISDQHKHSGWCRSQLTAQTGQSMSAADHDANLTRAAELITRSIQAHPPRRISRDERDLWIALDPHVGSSAVMRP